MGASVLGTRATCVRWRVSQLPRFPEEGQKLVRESHGSNYARLAELKRRLDPENVFRRERERRAGDVLRVRARRVKIRSAVLEEFGQPLVVQEVDLAEPKDQRGARGARRVRRLPHRSVHGVRSGPRRDTRPACSGTRGPESSSGIGPGVTLVAPGDHVITLFAPECGECIHCRSGRTNRCTAIRDQQGLGFLPDGTTRLSRGGEPMRHFMGTSTFAEYTVMPEIALAKVVRRRRRSRVAHRSRAASRRGSARRCTRPTCSPARRAAVFGCGLARSRRRYRVQAGRR